MQVDQCFGYLLVSPVNLTYPVDAAHPDRFEPERYRHLPSTTFTPSQTAPTRPVAMTVTTALKV